jgi:hypothetical protein
MVVVVIFIHSLTQQWLVKQKSLHNSSGKGTHGKSSMDDFLFLALELFLGIQLCQFFGSPANVTGSSVSVMLVKGGSLYHTNEQEDLKIGSPTDGFDGTENVRVGVSITGPVDAGLLGEDSDNGKHADTSVFDFGPASMVQVGLNIGKAHRVESHISGHGSVQLFGADQERDGSGHFLSIQGNRSSPLGSLVLVMGRLKER